MILAPFYFQEIGLRAASQFSLDRFVETYAGGDDALTSFFLRRVRGLTSVGEYVVPYAQDRRPDLASEAVFGGDSGAWWVLLYFNGLVSVAEFRSGMLVTYPLLSDVVALASSLRSRGV